MCTQLRRSLYLNLHCSGRGEANLNLCSAFDLNLNLSLSQQLFETLFKKTFAALFGSLFD